MVEDDDEEEDTVRKRDHKASEKIAFKE